VDALVLIDAAGFNLGPSERPRMVSFATSRAGSLLARLPGKRLVVEASLRQVFHDASRITPERLSEYLAAANRPGTFPAIRSLGASPGDRQAVVAQSLPRIQARALVLWGDDDHWIPIAHADRFVAAIPGARKVVIPAAATCREGVSSGRSRAAPGLPGRPPEATAWRDRRGRGR
jgi:pimeloyl-ACP methyl ester carboxylesterase